jgi:membrane protein DedA with SNARE-associated domain/rhodanese-related sulfurtransferase
MMTAMEILTRYGPIVVFLGMFIEQIGLPIPVAPVLLAAGALAGTGKISFLAVLALAVAGGLVGDLVWFYLGRLRGIRVLGILCKVSISPDTCVRRTENTFVRYGVRTLLVAKFLPGLNLIAPPLAGIFKVSLPRFILFDGIGAGLYSAAFIIIGLLFRNQVERVLLFLAHSGEMAGWILGTGLGLYIVYRMVQRQRLLQRLKMDRITPEELQRKLAAGEQVVVVDLRSKMDVELMPYLIPGAMHIPAEEIDQRHTEIPRDQDLILYCACPNEVTSASVALKLRKKGLTRIRPLLGGLPGWRYAEGLLTPLPQKA